MINYNRLLRSFFTHNYPRHPLFMPFRQYGMVCASDAHVMIRIDESLLKEQNIACGDSSTLPDTNKVVPEFNLNVRIKAELIEKKTQMAKMVKEHLLCEECRGTSEVTWRYIDLDGREWLKNNECPVCEGKGHLGLTGRMIRDPKQIYKINDFSTAGFRIAWLLDVMEALEVDSLTLRGEKPNIILLTTQEDKIQIIIAAQYEEEKDVGKPIVIL